MEKIGTDAAETLVGGQEDDFLDGGNGNNVLVGLGGNDTITGGSRGDARPPFSDYNIASYGSKGVTASVTALFDGSGGHVDGDGSVGSDLILKTDSIILTKFDDTITVLPEWSGSNFVGTDFSAFSLGEAIGPFDQYRTEGSFLEIRPNGGNDTVVGHSDIRLSFYSPIETSQPTGLSIVLSGPNSGVATGLLYDSDFSVSFTGVDSFRGTTFADTMVGSGGSQIFASMGGDDTIDGGSGVDLLFFGSVFPGPVNLNLSLTSPQTFSSEQPGAVTLTSIEGAWDSMFSDNFIGNSAANFFVLNYGGDDTVDGGDGLDTVVIPALERHFTISLNDEGDKFIVSDTRAPSNEPNEYRHDSKELQNVELLVFKDKVIDLRTYQDSPAPPPPEEPDAPPENPSVPPSEPDEPSDPGGDESPAAGTYSLDVIVSILGQVFLLKGLTETVSASNHTIEYAGSVFNYSEYDPFFATVIRDGEFTKEFSEEIAESFPDFAGITYASAVGFVGASAIDDVLIAVAGADGNYVG
jgi:hypothetical protein